MLLVQTCLLGFAVIILNGVLHDALPQYSHTKTLNISINCSEFEMHWKRMEAAFIDEFQREAHSIPTPFLAYTITNSTSYAYIALHFESLYLPSDVYMLLRSARIPGKQDELFNISATTFSSGVHYTNVYTQPVFARQFRIEFYFSNWRYAVHATRNTSAESKLLKALFMDDIAIVAPSKSCYGFSIDQFFFSATSATSAAGSGRESICANDNTEEAICSYTNASTRIAYLNAQPVARLLIQKSSGELAACTGWLVGSEGHLLTNNHCIADENDAQSTTVEFMADATACDQSCEAWGACPGVVEAIATKFIHTSVELDYTLVVLETNVNVTEKYGFLRLQSSPVAVGETIYIPQFPLYYGKRIAMVDDFNKSLVITGARSSGCNFSKGYSYTGDTQAGSSGSPVISMKDYSVVGLHHCGSFCSNTGIPSYQIVQDLKSLGILPDMAATSPGSNNSNHLPPFSPAMTVSALLTSQYKTHGVLVSKSMANIPSVSVDQYIFSLAQDAKVAFDVLSVEISDDGTFQDLNNDCKADYVDSVLYLYDKDGTLLASNDDAYLNQGQGDGSKSARDPYLATTLTEGKYILAVASIPSNASSALVGYTNGQDPALFDCLHSGTMGPYQLEILSSGSLRVLSAPKTSLFSSPTCDPSDLKTLCALDLRK
uniref:Uncharacterized protein AlNc14C7G992 n=1 Tax=Albugo laibachii Nc14 TaxID=890382 RepID=F0W1R2_9STRA|nr:conserved hypothetical protein [Albugo laibachii Nc14]|eukprot:CCA14991.1 conserved hypothetical protein [Albugo laibachii Nc14]